MPTPIQVTTVTSAATLAAAAVGTGVTVTGSPSLTDGADGNACGTFTGFRSSGTGADTVFLLDRVGITGLDSGVILTNGKAASAQSDTYGSVSDETSWDHAPGVGADPLAGSFNPAFEVGDDIVLTFDIIPAGTMLTIPFAYMSDEYTEFVLVPTPVNDPAYVRLNGVNKFVVPGTAVEISVDTVYPESAADANGYPEYYSGSGGVNGNMPAIAYDGQVLLNLVMAVTPGATHTLQFEVKDKGDGKVDTAILFGPITSSTPTEGDIVATLTSLLPFAPGDYITTLAAEILAGDGGGGDSGGRIPVACLSSFPIASGTIPQGCIASS